MIRYFAVINYRPELAQSFFGHIAYLTRPDAAASEVVNCRTEAVALAELIRHFTKDSKFMAEDELYAADRATLLLRKKGG